MDKENKRNRLIAISACIFGISAAALCLAWALGAFGGSKPKITQGEGMNKKINEAYKELGTKESEFAVYLTNVASTMTNNPKYISVDVPVSPQRGEDLS